MDAYVYIRIASGSMAEVLAVLAAKPGIKRVVPTVGEWDLLLYARGATLDEIGNNVLAEVHQIPGVVQTITAPVVPPDRAGLFGVAVSPPQILPNACYVHIKAAAGKAVDIGEALAGMEEVRRCRAPRGPVGHPCLHRPAVGHGQRRDPRTGARDPGGALDEHARLHRLRRGRRGSRPVQRLELRAPGTGWFSAPSPAHRRARRTGRLPRRSGPTRRPRTPVPRARRASAQRGAPARSPRR